MTSAAPPRRQTAGLLVLVVWLVAAYAVALKLIAGRPWEQALWQSCACLLVSPLMTTFVLKVLSAPKKLAPAAMLYQALIPLLTLGQYLLPWFGWSALIRWINGDNITWTLALRAGGAVTVLSYLGGFTFMLALRPRPSDVEVTDLEVRIAGLPPAFDGYRILHVSDIHGGSWLARASVAAKLAPAISLAPDLVVFTGDLAARSTAVDASASDLVDLRARDGKFAVLGNHDTWVGEELLANALAHAGFRVLANEHVALERGGDTLYLAGVKDASYTRQDDLPAALRGIPDGAPVIVLTHSPDVVLKPTSVGADPLRPALFLAGHTHGGQIVFPWFGPLYVPTRLGRRRMSGLIEVNGRQVFVNRGLGEVFLPLRLNCPPEIALITLRSV
jgi:hypothetical protein